MSHVLVSAGELSGDLSMAPVLVALQQRRPDLAFFGMGGDQLAATGMQLCGHSGELAVTGLSEVLGRVPALAGASRELWREYRRRRPTLAILADYPGFNLRLAWLLRRAGIPVLYYIAPQRWAWLGWRAASLGRLVDRLAVTLPFEEPWFRARGVPAVHVGHPLIDRFRLPERDAARQRFRLDARPVVGLFPGSRRNEIERHLPILDRAMGRLTGVQPLVATADATAEKLCAELAPHLDRASAADVWAAADVALCKSGTATLEAAMAGVPSAVFYRLSSPSFAIARRVVRLRYVALPNIILERELMPELLQERMDAETAAAAVRQLLDPREMRRQREGMQDVVRRLGPPGVAHRVADLAIRLLRGEGSRETRR